LSAAEAEKKLTVELGRQLKERDAQLEARQSDLALVQKQQQDLHAEAETLRNQMAEATRVLASREGEIRDAKSRIAELLNQVNSGRAPARPKIQVNRLVTDLRTQIEGINAEVMKNPGPGGMLVDGCQFEIKGGLDVTDGLFITQLAEGVLGADTVSTIRFTLRPAAVVRVIDDT
jgi:uncharacterized phage infection (PIP) family protein YhgE